jgi:hypothetical protein
MMTRRPGSIAKAGTRSPRDARSKTTRKHTPDLVKHEVNEAGMSKHQAALVKQNLIGRWRLTRMSNWDHEFMDEESPASIEFTAGGDGEFHFGYVHCGVDWRPEQLPSGLGAAFTFDGNDEMTPTQGRGWAAVQIDGTLKGHLYFHQGDDSAFWAKRQRF